MDEKGAMTGKGLLLSLLAIIAIAGVALPMGADILLALAALLIAISELYHRMTAGKRAKAMAWIMSIMLIAIGILTSVSLVRAFGLLGMLGTWTIYLVALYWLVETGRWFMGRKY